MFTRPAIVRGFAAAVAATVVFLPTHLAVGQGCAPARFAGGAIPGTEGDIYLGRGTWQGGLSFRHLTSNRLIQGHDDMGPSSVVKSQSVFASLTYGVSDRFAVSLTVPLLHGSHETTYPDGQRHQNTATGLGDISMSASLWMFNANPLRPGGNLGLSLGLKIPTGNNHAAGTWWSADGSTIAWPVHQSIQLGDGGWGLNVGVQGFQPVFSRTYLYGGGSYTLNPRKTTNVVKTPGSSQHWAVPDTWNASAGMAFAVLPDQGFSTRLGFTFEGTRKRDLLGGTDSLEHRLPATAGYLMPAVTITRGPHTVTLSFGMRVYKDFLPSIWDDANGKKGGGGLAKYLFQGGYVVRF